MEANALDALVKEQRNIPGYKDKLVYRELLAEIIAVARGAPASMHTQPWFSKR